MAAWGLASRLVLATAVLLVAGTCTAQYSPQDFVDLHNAARANEGVQLEDVHWDETVAAYAEWYAGQRRGDCAMEHSDSYSHGYGENLFWGGGGGGWEWTAADAVGMWMAEKQYYDYDSNTCADGQICGHYTQVVWRSSTAIGCARVVCDGDRGVFITCNYSPGGNYNGQRPYMAARTLSDKYSTQ